jgi:hypothetical protein
MLDVQVECLLSHNDCVSCAWYLCCLVQQVFVVAFGSLRGSTNMVVDGRLSYMTGQACDEVGWGGDP